MLGREDGNSGRDESRQPEVEQRGRQRLVFPENRAHTQDGVQPDLGHQRENGAHRRVGDRVGARQPEIERPASRFHEESNAEHRGPRIEQYTVIGGERRCAACEVRHVESAGDTIDERNTDQE